MLGPVSRLAFTASYLMLPESWREPTNMASCLEGQSALRERLT